MKITQIDAIVLDTSSDRRPILARVTTDTGVYGYGEASVGFCAGAPAAQAMILEMGKYVLGMNPLHHEKIWSTMYDNSFWACGGGVICYAAMSAIDMALWDIKGKTYGVPLYELLGGKCRDKLRCYASQLQHGWREDDFVDLGKTEDYVEVAKRVVDDGYNALKYNFLVYDRDGKWTGILNGPQEHWVIEMIEERVAAVREAVGKDVDILLENHSYSDFVSAEQIARAVEKYNIFFMEEAGTPMNVEALSELQKRISIPLAGGERVYGKYDFNRYFKAGAMRVAQPDLGTCGGITEGKKICDLASAYDISVQTHVCGSPIATTASLHMEAAIPNFVIREWHVQNRFPSFKLFQKYDYSPVNGYCPVPELPGIGQELSDYALAHCDAKTIRL